MFKNEKKEFLAVGMLCCLIAASSVVSIVAVRHYSLKGRDENRKEFSDLRASIPDRPPSTAEIEQRQSALVERYRNSVACLYTHYRMLKYGKVVLSAQAVGTGFVIGKGLLATARHVVQPWFRSTDGEDIALLKQGATPEIEEVVAFFPEIKRPVVLYGRIVSGEDGAIMRFDPTGTDLVSLPLAKDAPQMAQRIGILGYPDTKWLLLAKAPWPVYNHFAGRERFDLKMLKELANLSLVRPTFTPGQIGDVSDVDIVYSASTTQGASGSPVFRMETGEVVAINANYMTGFDGAALGTPVRVLEPLIQKAALVEKVAE